MGNASQINRSRDSVRVERRSDLNESDLGEVYCIYYLRGFLGKLGPTCREAIQTLLKSFSIKLFGPFKCHVTQMGVAGVKFARKKRYEVVWFNVI